MTMLSVLDTRALETYVTAHGCVLVAEPTRMTPVVAEEGVSFSGLAHQEAASRLRHWLATRRP